MRNAAPADRLKELLHGRTARRSTGNPPAHCRTAPTPWLGTAGGFDSGRAGGGRRPAGEHVVQAELTRACAHQGK
jgi:hypothetical protein